VPHALHIAVADGRLDALHLLLEDREDILQLAEAFLRETIDGGKPPDLTDVAIGRKQAFVSKYELGSGGWIFLIWRRSAARRRAYLGGFLRLLRCPTCETRRALCPLDQRTIVKSGSAHAQSQSPGRKNARGLATPTDASGRAAAHVGN
jgi:hypothetical protein